MFLEGRVGAEGFITAVAAVRTEAGMGVQMHLQLSSSLELFIARWNGARQLRPRPRLPRVPFHVLPQVVLPREDLAAVLQCSSTNQQLAASSFPCFISMATWLHLA